MPPVNHLPRISVIASLFFALGASVSFGQAEPDDTARKAREARELADAIEACDKGASAPLDFTAKAPPVQFSQLYPRDFDRSRLKTLQLQCQRAWIGAPEEKRLHLQWLRVTVMLNEPGTQWLAPQVRRLAEEGSAEAQYLVHELHRLAQYGADKTGMVTEEEARSSILKAADQGHMAALLDLAMYHYQSRLFDATMDQHGSGLFKRDLRKAVLYARRLESAPPQGNGLGEEEEAIRLSMPLFIAKVTLEEDGFSATDNRVAFKLAEGAMKSGGKDSFEAARIVAGALRAGRGTRKDPARARAILEERAMKDREAAVHLAEMLAHGEGGPADGKRALEIVRKPETQHGELAITVEADILLQGNVIGYRPQEAIKTLARSSGAENQIRLAGLLIDYHTRMDDPGRLISTMSDYAAAGRSDVALALARLKLSGNSQFSDEDGARSLLQPLADAGNREALWLYAATQYRNLGSTSDQPMRRDEGLSDAELMALIDEGIRKEEPPAFLLKAKLLRRGVVYPQDDRATSDMLKQAAERDNIEALLLLGDAYDDGLGIAKDKKKRLEAWRRAAALGSLKAKSKIAHAFTFDSFDRLMTLEEGVTWRIALYNNGYGRSLDGPAVWGDAAAEIEFMGLFMGRAMEAGADAVAEAVMNAFRQAPAGLDDNNLVGLGKAFPPEIKVAIEKRLAREGFFKGQPAGYWGPDARKALAEWVDAQGPVAEEASAVAPSDDVPATQKTTEMLPQETIGRLWDQIRAQFGAAKNDKQKRAALAKVNTLALYGNIDARWALLPNYHKLEMVRRVVTAAEITRYGLDLMVTRPPAAEKVEFEVIFNTTQIYQDGKGREFGQAVINAIRDDARLQDPLVLGGILQQFMFAPGACDAVLDAGKRSGVDGLGAEGCDEATLSALVAFAKAKGPSGIDERNRKAAAESIRAMDQEASR